MTGDATIQREETQQPGTDLRVLPQSTTAASALFTIILENVQVMEENAHAHATPRKLKVPPS